VARSIFTLWDVDDARKLDEPFNGPRNIEFLVFHIEPSKNGRHFHYFHEGIENLFQPHSARMDFADGCHDFRIERGVQKIVIGENDGISDKFHNGNPELGHIFDHVGGDADPGHFLNRMCLVVTVDEQVCFIAINPNRVISFFRLNAEQFVGYPAAELSDIDIEAFPVR